MGDECPLSCYRILMNYHKLFHSHSLKLCGYSFSSVCMFQWPFCIKKTIPASLIFHYLFSDLSDEVEECLRNHSRAG